MAGGPPNKKAHGWRAELSDGSRSGNMFAMVCAIYAASGSNAHIMSAPEEGRRIEEEIFNAATSLHDYETRVRNFLRSQPAVMQAPGESSTPQIRDLETQHIASSSSDAGPAAPVDSKNQAGQQDPEQQLDGVRLNVDRSCKSPVNIPPQRSIPNPPQQASQRQPYMPNIPQQQAWQSQLFMPIPPQQASQRQPFMPFFQQQALQPRPSMPTPPQQASWRQPFMPIPPQQASWHQPFMTVPQRQAPRPQPSMLVPPQQAPRPQHYIPIPGQQVPQQPQPFNFMPIPEQQAPPQPPISTPNPRPQVPQQVPQQQASPQSPISTSDPRPQVPQQQAQWPPAFYLPPPSSQWQISNLAFIRQWQWPAVRLGQLVHVQSPLLPESPRQRLEWWGMVLPRTELPPEWLETLSQVMLPVGYVWGIHFPTDTWFPPWFVVGLLPDQPWPQLLRILPSDPQSLRSNVVIIFPPSELPWELPPLPQQPQQQQQQPGQGGDQAGTSLGKRKAPEEK